MSKDESDPIVSEHLDLFKKMEVIIDKTKEMANEDKKLNQLKDP